MKFRKAISGGQTGADKTALVEAKLLGFDTGGTVPLGCWTEAGPDWSLTKEYGCVESWSSDYKPRTHKNAADGDCTLWYGNIGSPGYWCTVKGCKIAEKLLFPNPTEDALKNILDTYEIINFAGNRASKNPKVVGLVQDAFRIIAKYRG